MYVPLETLRRATRLVDSFADLDQMPDPAQFIVSGMAELVGCDIVTYNEISAGPDQLNYYTDYPPGCLDPASLTVFEAHLHEHPLLRHYRVTGDGSPAKISDFTGRQQFHKLGIYSEFFRHIPVEHQMAFTLPATAQDPMLAIALNRAGGDFAETDREVVRAVTAPLGSALRRARSAHRAGAALATLETLETLETLGTADSGSPGSPGGPGSPGSPGGPGGPGGLTDRETEVLQLAARGRTNAAIASAINVSPRTIAKHLEHIYRKLGVTSRAAAVYRTAAAAAPGRAGRPYQRAAAAARLFAGRSPPP